MLHSLQTKIKTAIYFERVITITAICVDIIDNFILRLNAFAQVCIA